MPVRSRRRPPARARAAGLLAPALLVALTLVIAGCGSSGAASGNGPNWKPKPSFQGEGIEPAAPTTAPAPIQPGSSGSANNGSTKQDPAVVATRLTAPTAVTVLPDNTALVGERTTGRILQVQPVAGLPVRLIRTITGLSTAGGGGLLDLALSPSYSQDNLIFAYITTRTDNRVVAFTLHGTITPVLTGIPRGPTDNTGRIAFGPGGDLYVGTGDAGRPRLADDPHSLAGKILRITDIGGAAPGNPVRHSPVFASGLRVVNGLCVDSSSGAVFETSAGTGGRGLVNFVAPRANFGWPRQAAGYRPPLGLLPAAYGSPGGCAVNNEVLYETSLTGQALLGARLALGQAGLALGRFDPSEHKTYGRLRTVVAAADGALWLTTSNRDGHGTPVPTDERVIRIIPSGGGGPSGNPV
jgi:glucose/arabinose dehydrogenase